MTTPATGGRHEVRPGVTARPIRVGRAVLQGATPSRAFPPDLAASCLVPLFFGGACRLPFRQPAGTRGLPSVRRVSVSVSK